MKTLREIRDELASLELGDHCYPYSRGFDAGFAEAVKMLRAFSPSIGRSPEMNGVDFGNWLESKMNEGK
jgi:hypothetical protein